jgi:hypothetical protein
MDDLVVARVGLLVLLAVTAFLRGAMTRRICDVNNGDAVLC